MNAYALYQSPIGTLTLLQQDDALVAILLKPTTLAEIWQPQKTPLLATLCAQLDAYFAGERVDFSVPLRPSGTPFQQEVWKRMAQIPYGETLSYGQLAAAIGRPKAARAVGGACNRNAIPLVIPCHRVLGHNGKLVGFNTGVFKKEFLLRLEGAL